MEKETTKQVQKNPSVREVIFGSDDITWQSVIVELVKEGKIDPWDVNITDLAQEYIKIINKLKEHNFRLSGKVILGAALLLKLKMDRLNMANLIALTEEPEDLVNPIDFEEGIFADQEKHFTKAGLNLRIPRERKRKVTVNELISALKKAIEVDERRQKRIYEIGQASTTVAIPEKKVDIFSKIEDVYNRLRNLFGTKKKKVLEFTHIVPSKERKDIIWTFIPLLHLANQGKIELQQKDCFGKIYVSLDRKNFDTELERESEKVQVEATGEKKDE